MKKYYYSDSVKCQNPDCDNFVKRYGTGLMKTCGQKECIKVVVRACNLEKYGHISNLHGKEGKEKVQKTLKEKYGENITNISQIQSVKEKKKETCRKNFGVDWPMQSNDIRDKSKNTCIEKYGVDNVSKCSNIIEKIRQNLYKINEENGLTVLENATIKRRISNLKKYGFEYYYQTEEFKEKYRNIMLKKYSVDNVFKSEFFNDLMIKRGVRHANSEREKYFSEFKTYTHKTRLLTEGTFRKYSDLLCSTYVRSNDYHLDHIFSVVDGFLNNVEPEIIASIVNLQVIPAKVNHSKNKKSWITKEELLKQYEILIRKDKK